MLDVDDNKIFTKNYFDFDDQILEKLCCFCAYIGYLPKKLVRGCNFKERLMIIKYCYYLLGESFVIKVKERLSKY